MYGESKGPCDLEISSFSAHPASVTFAPRKIRGCWNRLSLILDEQ